VKELLKRKEEEKREKEMFTFVHISQFLGEPVY